MGLDRARGSVTTRRSWERPLTYAELVNNTDQNCLADQSRYAPILWRTGQDQGMNP